MTLHIHTAGACQGLNLKNLIKKNEEILTRIKTIGPSSAWLGASPDFSGSIQVRLDIVGYQKYLQLEVLLAFFSSSENVTLCENNLGFYLIIPVRGKILTSNY